MSILHSWKRSLLRIVSWTEYTRFVRENSATAYDTYVMLCTRWHSRLIIIGYLIFLTLWHLYDWGYISTGMPVLVPILGGTLCLQLLIVQTFVEARLQVGAQEQGYMSFYVGHIFYIGHVAKLLIVILIFDGMLMLALSGLWYVYMGLYIGFLLEILFKGLLFLIPTVLPIGIFCFLDSHGTWYQFYKAIRRAVMIVLYDLPSFILFALGVYLLVMVAVLLMVLMGPIVLLMISPWLVTLYATKYVQLCRENPQVCID